MSTWTITGQYMETCNCAFLCPCITSNLTAQPTEGDCKAAVALHIDKGEKDGGQTRQPVVHCDAAFAGPDGSGQHRQEFSFQKMI